MATTGPEEEKDVAPVAILKEEEEQEQAQVQAQLQAQVQVQVQAQERAQAQEQAQEQAQVQAQVQAQAQAQVQEQEQEQEQHGEVESDHQPPPPPPPQYSRPPSAPSQEEVVVAVKDENNEDVATGGQRELELEDKLQRERELREKEQDEHRNAMQRLEEQIAALKESKEDNNNNNNEEEGRGSSVKETEDKKRKASDMSIGSSGEQDGDADADAPPKKRRGRPPGSKNREARKLPFSFTEGETPAGTTTPGEDGGEASVKPKVRGRPKKNPGTEPSVYVLANERGQLNAKNWLKHYGMLIAFKEKYAHCNVPVGTHHIDPVTGAIDEEKNKFRRWIMMMRTDHRYLREGRHTSLTQEKIQLLTMIGFQWRLLERKFSWDEQFDRLLKWKEEFGNVNVPQKDTKKKFYEGLGDWVLKLRRAYRECRLQQEQIDRLEAVGFKWTLRKKGGTIQERMAATAMKRAIQNNEKKSQKKRRKSKSATETMTMTATTTAGAADVDMMNIKDESKIIPNSALENAAAVAAATATAAATASNNSAALDAAAAAAAAAVSGITADDGDKDASGGGGCGGGDDGNDTGDNKDNNDMMASIPQELPHHVAEEELEQAQLSPVHIEQIEEC